MSKFHGKVRDLLEDVHCFLTDSLRHETLSNAVISNKERILSRLKAIDEEYPELQLNFETVDDLKTEASNSSPASPLPYVDMNAGSSSKMQFIISNVEKDNYDACFPKDKYDSVEIQSVTESEDYSSEEAKHIPDIAASDLYACEKSGYLDKKKKETIKGWLSPFQKRWCAIKNGVMYYYEKTTDRKQKGSIVLYGYEVRVPADDSKDGKKYNYCFELVCPGRRTYQFSAPTEKDLQQWIIAVEHNNQSLSTGKTSNRESYPLPSIPKSLYSDNLPHESEEIYETVEDDTHEDIEKSLHENDEKKSSLIISSEEMSQNHIFNYSEWYVGLWDCSGSDDTELSFYRGDLIHIVSKEYDNFAWWIGETQGKVGFVPKSYLMEAYQAC